MIELNLVFSILTKNTLINLLIYCLLLRMLKKIKIKHLYREKMKYKMLVLHFNSNLTIKTRCYCARDHKPSKSVFLFTNRYLIFFILKLKTGN